MLQAEIPPNILRDARGVCGINPSWQALYRSCKLCLLSPPSHEMTLRETHLSPFPFSHVMSLNLSYHIFPVLHILTLSLS